MLLTPCLRSPPLSDELQEDDAAEAAKEAAKEAAAKAAAKKGDERLRAAKDAAHKIERAAAHSGKVVEQLIGGWKGKVDAKGRPCGRGVLAERGGGRYVGEMKRGNYHGLGLLWDAKSKVVYGGDFRNDCYHGDGVLREPDDEGMSLLVRGAFRHYNCRDPFVEGIIVNSTTGEQVCLRPSACTCLNA